jgi:glycosyltransferase involved in cell wall biosynthesis
MRVLVLPKWYPWPERPVFGLFCREHARAAALHHDVRVLAFTPQRMHGLYRIWEDHDEPLPTTRLVYRRPFVRPAAMATQLAGMWDVVKRFKPDLIHAPVFEAGFPAVLLARRLGVPVVLTEHYTGFQRGLVTGYDLKLARYAFRHADLVTPVSQDLRRQLERVEPQGRYRVVPNVVDPAIFHPGERERSSGPLRLLNVASLDEKKRHADLLDALTRLELDYTLDIAGEGELAQRLRGRAAYLGLDSVRFLGSQSQQQIAQRMREADVFVLSSEFENLPVVALEATASGLPIVATNVGGVPEIVDEATGVLVPARDPEALAAGILAVAQRSFDRAALAARARDRYGIEAVGRVWDEIYSSLGSTRSSTTR